MTHIDRYMKKSIGFLVCLFFACMMHAQLDSIFSRIEQEGDFRFRIEQDWNSRRSDGTFRTNRTRLRYRLRTGLKYSQDWYSFGFRIRTGDLRKQQDPQLTLGTAFEEFGTLPLGFEKVYFKGNIKQFSFWLGKYDFSFERNNELFWSDNVYPEGVYGSYVFPIRNDVVQSVAINAGHYIIGASGAGFDADEYVQGIQAHMKLLNERLELFPSFYRFRNIDYIPDNVFTPSLDYSIFHVGSRVTLLPKSAFKFELDWYYNVEDYASDVNIPDALKNEKTGFVAGLKWGETKKKNDYFFSLTYAYLERFSALDYMAQNDWARWDYSDFNSPDGRLTNMNGFEFVAAYAINKNAKLVMKVYQVNQLVRMGAFEENGSRVRLDLDVRM